MASLRGKRFEEHKLKSQSLKSRAPGLLVSSPSGSGRELHLERPWTVVCRVERHVEKYSLRPGGLRAIPPKLLIVPDFGLHSVTQQRNSTVPLGRSAIWTGQSRQLLILDRGCVYRRRIQLVQSSSKLFLSILHPDANYPPPTEGLE